MPDFCDVIHKTQNFFFSQESTFEYISKFIEFFEKNLALINRTLAEPSINQLWAPGAAKVDIIITMPLTGNEISFFLAHKLNATMTIW